MAKRTTVRKFSTEEVQGEGSYVVLSSLKIKEIRQLRKVGKGKTDEFDESIKMLANHIVDWDWVDDSGDDLPLPEGDVAVIDLLTNEEAELLADMLTRMSDPKSSETK